MTSRQVAAHALRNPSQKEFVSPELSDSSAAVNLYWLPLGAGGHSVKCNGRAYEAMAALKERRDRCDLYHSALQIEIDSQTYVIEQTPVPDLDGGGERVGGSRRRPRGPAPAHPPRPKWAWSP